jgi:hypothetical protein
MSQGAQVCREQEPLSHRAIKAKNPPLLSRSAKGRFKVAQDFLRRLSQAAQDFLQRFKVAQDFLRRLSQAAQDSFQIKKVNSHIEPKATSRTIRSNSNAQGKSHLSRARPSNARGILNGQAHQDPATRTWPRGTTTRTALRTTSST